MECILIESNWCVPLYQQDQPVRVIISDKLFSCSFQWKSHIWVIFSLKEAKRKFYVNIFFNLNIFFDYQKSDFEVYCCFWVIAKGFYFVYQNNHDFFVHLSNNFNNMV